MPCTTVVIAGLDKYYDCVNGKCTEKAGGQYKNDPTCAGKCEGVIVPEPSDDTMTYVLIGAAVLGALYFMTQKR